MSKNALACLLLLLVAASSISFAQNNVRSARSKLNLLKNDLDEKRSALRQLERKGRSLFFTLSDLNRSLYKMETRLRDAKREEKRAIDERVHIEEKLAKDTLEYTNLRDRLQRRLRALYVLGEGAIPRAMLGADSFEDLSFRRYLVERMAQNDAVLFQKHRLLKERVEGHAKSIREQADLATALRQEIQEETELISAARAERRAAIARIDEEKELAVDAVRENVKQQRELNGFLMGLQRKSVTPKRGRGILAGTLFRPAKGTLIRRFGTVREKGSGAKLVSNGLHFRMPIGTAVHAVANGYVVHEGWMRGFGQLVIIDHGEGHHTLYAHLSETFVARGDTVDEGKIIAHSGDTESLNGEKLYFELREKGRPKNPEPYLRY